MTEIHSYAPRKGTRDDFLRHAYHVFDETDPDIIYEWTIHINDLVETQQFGKTNE